jgi:hypothetical protein
MKLPRFFSRGTIAAFVALAAAGLVSGCDQSEADVDEGIASEAQSAADPVEEVTSVELSLAEAEGDSEICLDDFKACVEEGGTPKDCYAEFGACLPEKPSPKPEVQDALKECFEKGKECVASGAKPMVCKAGVTKCIQAKKNALRAKFCKEKLGQCKAGELPPPACKKILAKCKEWKGAGAPE